MRYALIQNGVVVNIILWDGKSPYAPAGALVQSDTANIGDTWDGTNFTPAQGE